MERFQHLYASMATMVCQKSSSPVIFFDVDGTLILRTSCEYLLLRHLLIRGNFPLTNLVHALVWNLGKARTFFYSLHFNKLWYRGYSVDGLNKHIDAVFPSICRHISQGAINEMRRAHDGGSRIVLLSAAPDILVRRIGEYIGYHEVVATSFEIHNTIYTGRVTGIVPYAAGKIAAASAYAASLGVRLSDCTAYANAGSDIPLLESVGTAYAVNPSVGLQKHAMSKGWSILRFNT